jgi:hypothetical protein
LNAYLGGYWGGEKIRDLDKNYKSTYGLTAPIGVSTSFGNFPAKGWSTSLFVSLIDIGSIASFRFQTDTKKHVNAPGDTTTTKVYELPHVELKDIISPGAFISIGLPKTPLSINFGAQVGPNLRKVTVSDDTVTNDYSDRMYWRLSVSLVVDIPIVNFYTKSKK